MPERFETISSGRGSGDAAGVALAYRRALTQARSIPLSRLLHKFDDVSSARIVRVRVSGGEFQRHLTDDVIESVGRRPSALCTPDPSRHSKVYVMARRRRGGVRRRWRAGGAVANSRWEARGRGVETPPPLPGRVSGARWSGGCASMNPLASHRLFATAPSGHRTTQRVRDSPGSQCTTFAMYMNRRCLTERKCHRTYGMGN